jgi:hypothetical protein
MRKVAMLAEFSRTGDDPIKKLFHVRLSKHLPSQVHVSRLALHGKTFQYVSLSLLILLCLSFHILSTFDEGRRGCWLDEQGNFA